MNYPQYRKLNWILFIIFIIYYVTMGIIFSFTGDPYNVFESQLAFSARTLQREYFWILYEGNMALYRLVQAMDFGFMIVYGTLIFTVLRGWTVKIDEDPNKELSDILEKWSDRTWNLAWCGYIAAGLDVIENILIFMMINEYTFHPWFPEEWAFYHSLCALIKWILIFFCIGIFLYVSNLYNQKKKLLGASNSTKDQ